MTTFTIHTLALPQCEHVRTFALPASPSCRTRCDNKCHSDQAPLVTHDIALHCTNKCHSDRANIRQSASTFARGAPKALEVIWTSSWLSGGPQAGYQVNSNTQAQSQQRAPPWCHLPSTPSSRPTRRPHVSKSARPWDKVPHAPGAKDKGFIPWLIR